MALVDIKDNLKEQFKSVMGRVRESDAYLRLSERYYALSPAGQKLSIAGVVFVAFLIVMAIPYSFYSGSQSLVEDYTAKRDVIRELFKVNREASALSPAPPPVAASELQTIARNQLVSSRLAPEQILGITDSPANVAGIAKTIDQSGIQISLAKLNLKQIVDIGNSLQNMPGTARMMGLEIKANMSDARYYDAIYKIVAFAAKPDQTAASKKGKKK